MTRASTWFRRLVPPGFAFTAVVIGAALLARGRADFGRGGRLVLTTAILVFSVFVADRIGLVTMIARGYRWLAYLVRAVFVLAWLTVGAWRVARGWRAGDALAATPSPAV